MLVLYLCHVPINQRADTRIQVPACISQEMWLCLQLDKWGIKKNTKIFVSKAHWVCKHISGKTFRFPMRPEGRKDLYPKEPVWLYGFVGCMKNAKKGKREVISSPKQFICFFFCFWLHLQINSAWRVKKKKTAPQEGKTTSTMNSGSSNKPPVWQWVRDNTHWGRHANKRQNLSCCMPPQMRQKGVGGAGEKKKKSLTGCRPSLFVCREKSWEKQHKWVWEIMQSKTMSVAGGGRGEDVGTSDLKPRDGAC